MNIGDLVRIKPNVNDQLSGRLAIVINVGTWSADVRFVDAPDNWSPRIALDCLEKIA
jgi:hypothetical protein